MSINASGVLRERVACSRSASHAPPVYRPTMALFGPMRGRSSAVSCAQSASASGSFIEVLLQEKLRRHRVDLAFRCLAFACRRASQPRLRFGGRVALVHARHRQLEASLQATGGILRLACPGMRLPRDRPRQADHEMARLPLRDEGFDLFEARDRAQRMGGAKLGLADGDANALEAEIAG